MIRKSAGRRRRIISGFVLLLGAAGFAGAADYPVSSSVVPLAPGGSADSLGAHGAGHEQQLGQPVVVENTAGAAGVFGVTRAERSAPDGYTVLWGMWGTNMANGAIYNLDFDFLKDSSRLASSQPSRSWSTPARPCRRLI